MARSLSNSKAAVSHAKRAEYSINPPLKFHWLCPPRAFDIITLPTKFTSVIFAVSIYLQIKHLTNNSTHRLIVMPAYERWERTSNEQSWKRKKCQHWIEGRCQLRWYSRAENQINSTKNTQMFNAKQTKASSVTRKKRRQRVFSKSKKTFTAAKP